MCLTRLKLIRERLKKGHAGLPHVYLGDICLLGVISAELLIVLSIVLNVTEVFDYECLQEKKLQTFVHNSSQVFAFNTEEIEREG